MNGRFAGGIIPGYRSQNEKFFFTILGCVGGSAHIFYFQPLWLKSCNIKNQISRKLWLLRAYFIFNEEIQIDWEKIQLKSFLKHFSIWHRFLGSTRHLTSYGMRIHPN